MAVVERAAGYSVEWVYYAQGCGDGPYLRTMTGSIEDCEAACAARNDCVAFQRNGNRCWLDDDRCVADAESAPRSKRSAALSTRTLKVSFGHVMEASPLLTICKGRCQTRRHDAHSSL